MARSAAVRGGLRENLSVSRAHAAGEREPFAFRAAFAFPAPDPVTEPNRCGLHE